jgi:cytoskeletal protein CcmA (bactofilin family)
MTDPPRRRLLDRLGSTPSLIAQHTQFIGDIDTEGALLVNGTVRGNGRIGGEVAISVGARWEGELQAQGAVISGTVVGVLTVEDKLEIGASARLHGRINARRIAVASGALIEGEMVCTGNEPIVEFVEKRATLPQS